MTRYGIKYNYSKCNCFEISKIVITANGDIKTSKYFRFQIEFRVAVLGTPKPSVQWYKDEVEIFSCERLEVKEEDEGGAVILKGENTKVPYFIIILS